MKLRKMRASLKKGIMKLGFHLISSATDCLIKLFSERPHDLPNFSKVFLRKVRRIIYLTAPHFL
jgi:hypothetical protein